MITVEETNIPTDTPVEVQCGAPVDLDIDALVAHYKDDPKALALAVQKFYLESQYESTLSLVLIPREDGTWCIFEGTCNLKMHKFKVVNHITTFPANRDNPNRPPSVAVNFVCSAAVARRLPVWIP